MSTPRPIKQRVHAFKDHASHVPALAEVRTNGTQLNAVKPRRSRTQTVQGSRPDGSNCQYRAITRAGCTESRNRSDTIAR
jgi:hypothetical protein